MTVSAALAAPRLFASGCIACVLLGSLCCQRTHAATAPATTVGVTETTFAAPSPASPISGFPEIPSLVARVRPVVVNVTIDELVTLPRADFEWPFDFFSAPFGQKGGENDRQFRRQGQGSGFIIDAQGHVVTNAHVVEGADVVRVRLDDDREFKARVKGRDTRLDVAVLELESAKDLPTAVLGSAEDLRVGEFVIAVGDPFGLGQTVTMGIVSAKSRTIGAGPYDDFIQTDASINPGNSGGPLFNMRGQVVGINTAINPRGRGIGFAIPIDALREVLPQLLQVGHVERGRLGVGIQPITWPLAKALGLESPRGALVADVEKGGPADRAGLFPGDVILAVADVRIARTEELPRVIARHAPGTKVTLTILREKRERRVEVTLDAMKVDEPKGADVVHHDGAGRYGVDVLDAPGGGALVRRVAPDSSAARELEPGDIVLEVNHAPVGSAKDLTHLLEGPPPLLLRIRRKDATRFVALEAP